MGREFEESALKTRELWRLMSAVEHELDWGICCDSCLECARKRVAIAIEEFFDRGCLDATTAVALARDREQNQCADCSSEELWVRQGSVSHPSGRMLVKPTTPEERSRLIGDGWELRIRS